MATTISKLAVAVTARTDKFNKAMKNAEMSTNRFRKSVFLTSKRVALLGAASAAAGALITTKLTKDSLANIDATTKFADRLGVATEQLVGLQHAAKRGGTEIKALNVGLQRMTRRIAEAAKGTGEAQGALEALMLDAIDLAKLRPDEQFLRIADAMTSVRDQGERIRLSFKLFDSEGVGLVNTLRLGSDGIRELMADADRLGVTFSRFDASKVEAANDAMFRMRQAFTGLGNELAIAVAPGIEKLANSIANSIAANPDTFNSLARAIDAIGNSGYYSAIGLNALQSELLGTQNAMLGLLKSDLLADVIALEGGLAKRVGGLASNVSPSFGAGLEGLGGMMSHSTFGDLIDVGVGQSIAENRAEIEALADDSAMLYQAMEDQAKRAREAFSPPGAINTEGALGGVDGTLDGIADGVETIEDRFASVIAMVEYLERNAKSPFERWQEDSLALQEAVDTGALSLERYVNAQLALRDDYEGTISNLGETAPRPGEFRQVILENVALNGVRNAPQGAQEVQSKQLDETNNKLDQMVDLLATQRYAVFA